MVKLHEHHTLEAHFEHIGINLSATNLGLFEYHKTLHFYSVRIDEVTVHELIRHDPGVKFVEHDSVPTWDDNWQDGMVKPAPPFKKRSSRLAKRWKTWDSSWFWAIAQLNSWGVRDDIKNSDDNKAWFDSELLVTAGMGVDVYVMDTGILIDHDRLQLGDDTDEMNPPGGHARNFWRRYGPNEGFGDDDGHGTSVAGCVIHTAPWANIVNVKVYKASVRERATAMGDIIDEHNKRKKDKPDGFRGSVINMSWGSHPEVWKPLYADALQKASDAGIGLSTSAGNDDNNFGTTPCGYTKYIACVGASTKKYEKAKFSNYDGNVTLYAPGKDIWTASRDAKDKYVRTVLELCWISFE
ncbi:peptidase S8/S53 domain-containing protein [Lophiotrema nucula]|uniref:Peptidase S8/S53 domain-containing protein n=1 Tax=Lophiotrema nucula TaxID=690887 RepID=A0A6A5YZP9_9PLEO|nr:peptidase S8/S53 domain-containing protein [Lophiotrema nucula]